MSSFQNEGIPLSWWGPRGGERRALHPVLFLRIRVHGPCESGLTCAHTWAVLLDERSLPIWIPSELVLGLWATPAPWRLAGLTGSHCIVDSWPGVALGRWGFSWVHGPSHLLSLWPQQIWTQ